MFSIKLELSTCTINVISIFYFKKRFQLFFLNGTDKNTAYGYLAKTVGRKEVALSMNFFPWVINGFLKLLGNDEKIS